MKVPKYFWLTKRQFMDLHPTHVTKKCIFDWQTSGHRFSINPKPYVKK
jgi:hypothetical protein